jgi:predicted HD phosphohydrolase
VAAKRYMCAVDPSYLAALSPASRLSLQVQGGPMSPGEVAEFEGNAYYRDAVRLRHWDDTAQVPGLAVPGPSHYRERLEAAARRAV